MRWSTLRWIGVLWMAVAVVCFAAGNPKPGWAPWLVHWVYMPASFAVGLAIAVRGWRDESKRFLCGLFTSHIPRAGIEYQGWEGGEMLRLRFRRCWCGFNSVEVRQTEDREEYST